MSTCSLNIIRDCPESRDTTVPQPGKDVPHDLPNFLARDPDQQRKALHRRVKLPVRHLELADARFLEVLVGALGVGWVWDYGGRETCKRRADVWWSWRVFGWTIW